MKEIYKINGEFTIYIEAESLEDAEDLVINDLTLGYGCDEVSINDSCKW